MKNELPLYLRIKLAIAKRKSKSKPIEDLRKYLEKSRKNIDKKQKKILEEAQSLENLKNVTSLKLQNHISKSVVQAIGAIDAMQKVNSSVRNKLQGGMVVDIDKAAFTPVLEGIIAVSISRILLDHTYGLSDLDKRTILNRVIEKNFPVSKETSKKSFKGLEHQIGPLIAALNKLPPQQPYGVVNRDPNGKT